MNKKIMFDTGNEYELGKIYKFDDMLELDSLEPPYGYYWDTVTWELQILKKHPCANRCKCNMWYCIYNTENKILKNNDLNKIT